MIDLTPDQLAKVRRILAEVVPECEVRAFGSRITGKATRFSDLDLVLVTDQPIDWHRLEALKDAFAQSDLPFMVDVVDSSALSDSFRALTAAHFEILYAGA